MLCSVVCVNEKRSLSLIGIKEKNRNPNFVLVMRFQISSNWIEGNQKTLIDLSYYTIADNYDFSTTD